MFLKVGDTFVSLYNISAFRLKEEKDGYRWIFWVDGTPFELEILFKTREEALKWLEMLEEQQLPDFSLTDEVIDGENLLNKSRKVDERREKIERVKSKLKKNLESVLASFLLVFVLVSLLVGMFVVGRAIIEILAKVSRSV